MSTRATIVSAMDTRLKTIRISAGYSSDLGLNVFIGKTSPFDDDETPGLNFLDVRDDPTDKEIHGKWMHSLSFQIMIVTKGASSLSAVRDMIADVYQAIDVDHTWGGVAISTSPVNDELEVDQEDRKLAGASIFISVLYRTDPFKT